MGGTNKSGLTQYCHVQLVPTFQLATSYKQIQMDDNGLFANLFSDKIVQGSISVVPTCKR